jgi:hypothetical protein
VAGVLKVFLDRLIEAGGAIAPSEKTGYTVPFDPEIFKLVALRAVSIRPSRTPDGKRELRAFVERCFAWFQRKYRRLVVRWERISACFNAFLSLATIHIWALHNRGMN